MSVVVPVYNRANLVEEAVHSALRQTLSDIEVIVVDDGSTDGTPSVVRGIGDDRLVLLEHGENRGGSAARNTGIHHASGDYVAFLDSDDRWRERKLELQVAELRSRPPEWVAAYCGFRKRSSSGWFDRADRVFSRRTGLEGGEELIAPLLLKEFAYGGGSTLLVLRSAVLELDGFDPSFERHQDVEFLLRLLLVGKLAYVDEILVDTYYSGSPSGDAVARSTARFNRRFEDLIARRDLTAAVRQAQDCMIAKHYLSNGRFSDGLPHLARARFPHIRDVLGIGLAIARGVHSKIS